MKKILQLLNVKAWLGSFLIKNALNKYGKHAATTLGGLLGAFITKHSLDQHGVVVDVPHFTEWLVLAFGGLSGWLVNWAQDTIDWDGDGNPG